MTFTSFNTNDLDKLEMTHGKIKRVFPWLNPSEFNSYIIIEFADTHKERVPFKRMNEGLREFLLSTHK
jgi:hypothetical protein